MYKIKDSKILLGFYILINSIKYTIYIHIFNNKNHWMIQFKWVTLFRGKKSVSLFNAMYKIKESKILSGFYIFINSIKYTIYMQIFKSLNDTI